MKRIKLTLVWMLLLAMQGIAAAQTAVKYRTVRNVKRVEAKIAPTREASLDNVVLTVPEGITTNYMRSAEVYWPWSGTIVPDKELGRSSDIIDGNDGHVYISNAYILKYITNSYYTGREISTHMNLSDAKGYFKGERDADNNIVLKLPQTMLLPSGSSDPDTPFHVALYKKTSAGLDGSSSYVLADNAQQQLVLKYDADTKSYSTLTGSSDDIPDLILGINAGDDTWLGYGEYNMTWQPVAESVVTPPADGINQKWELTNTRYINYRFEPETRIVDVVWSGWNVYVKGIDRNMPDAWVKGELNHNTRDSITFEANQYMGIDTVTSYHIFFKPAVKHDHEDSDWGNKYESFDFIPRLTLYYNSHDRTITSPKDSLCAVFNTNKDEVYNIDVARDMSFRMRPEKLDPTPSDPKDVYLYSYDDYSLLDFIYDATNVEGYIADTTRTYYNIFDNDGNTVTFSPADYTSLSEPMTNVPINFCDDNGDFYSGNNHTMVYIYDPDITRVGVQICNVGDDGKVYKSNVMWYDTNATGISDINAAGRPVHTTYYNVSGQHTGCNSKGVVIRVDEFANGSKKTTKLLR